jgi:hypothetical protein
VESARLDEAGLVVEATQLSAARLTALGDGDGGRPGAADPITLVRGAR